MTDEEGFDLALMDDADRAAVVSPRLSPAIAASGGRPAPSHVRIPRRDTQRAVPDDSLVSFRCAAPDGYAIEIYWEAADAPQD